MAELLCIGNAMVDVFAEVPVNFPQESFREQYGLTDPVQHITSEAAAAILVALGIACPPANVSNTVILSGGAQESHARHRVITSGGGAANTAKVAAHLGIRSAFAGAVGNDEFAAFFESALSRAGVSLYLARKNSPTGLFISLGMNTAGHPPASGCPRRIIAAAPSVALEFDADDVDEAMFAPQCDTPRVLLLEGFLLNRERLLRRVLELAEKYRLTLAFDPGTADNAAALAKQIRQNISPVCDSEFYSRFSLILFMNEQEAEAFAKVFDNTWEKLFTGGKILVVVKLAERGAVVFSGGEVYRVPAKPVEDAESTGAGDAFAAGFLAAWIRDESPEQCGMAGNAAAALVLKAPGTTTSPLR